MKTWLIVAAAIIRIVLWQMLGLVLSHGDEVETRPP
jgi:hypothetical protein